MNKIHEEHKNMKFQNLSANIHPPTHERGEKACEADAASLCVSSHRIDLAVAPPPPPTVENLRGSLEQGFRTRHSSKVRAGSVPGLTNVPLDSKNSHDRFSKSL